MRTPDPRPPPSPVVASLGPSPSPSLIQDLLLQSSSDVVYEVLSKLDGQSLTMLRGVSRSLREAVDASGLTRAGGGGAEGELQLHVRDFVDSVGKISWAKENGCTWDFYVVYYMDQRWTYQYHHSYFDCHEGINLEVLKWAMDRGCCDNDRSERRGVIEGTTEITDMMRYIDWDATKDFAAVVLSQNEMWICFLRDRLELTADSRRKLRITEMYACLKDWHAKNVPVFPSGEKIGMKHIRISKKLLKWYVETICGPMTQSGWCGIRFKERPLDTC